MTNVARVPFMLDPPIIGCCGADDDYDSPIHVWSLHHLLEMIMLLMVMIIIIKRKIRKRMMPPRVHTRVPFIRDPPIGSKINHQLAKHSPLLQIHPDPQQRSVKIHQIFKNKGQSLQKRNLSTKTHPTFPFLKQIIQRKE